MSVDPVQFQANEEQFQRQLARTGWMLPLLTFISLLSLGALLYIISQTPEVDSWFPPGFLLGLAGGFISTAIIFYFYEFVFAQRMEKRARYGRQSANRRRYAVTELRKNAALESWSATMQRLNEWSQGNLAAWQPPTRAAAQTMLDALNAALTGLQELDEVEEERAAPGERRPLRGHAEHAAVVDHDLPEVAEEAHVPEVALVVEGELRRGEGSERHGRGA